MKRFVFQGLLFALLLLAGVWAILTWIDWKGYSDEYYKRFLHPAPSLILGTSRAAQGIVPEVLAAGLPEGAFALPLENFAFSVVGSPYSETYYKAIEKKVGLSEDELGLFILSVDPYSLRSDKAGAKEEWLHLKGATIQKPNYCYLFRYCRPHKWINPGKHCTLHDDGWLEISGIPVDSASVAAATKRKMSEYNDWEIQKSAERMDWLIRTIDLLKANGTVYLVRIPVSPQMRDREDQVWPDFDQDIRVIADSMSLHYFSFIQQSGNYRTTDGNHLYRDDAILFSKALSDSILLCAPSQ